MASSCFVCGKSPIGRMEENKESKAYLNFMKRIKHVQFEVDLGAGCRETFTFDEANNRYMTRYFPDSDRRVYCCPPVFEYKHPGEPSDIITNAKNDENVPFLTFTYDTLKEERKGEVPEEKTIQMFSTMFQKYNIPSFIIHGYNWKTIYMKKLVELDPNAYKSFRKLGLKEGEMDLFISIPGKCFMIVEVKAVDPRNKTFLGNVVTKAFSQCGKTVTFLSTICCNLQGYKNIPLIKVVALPNCEMNILKELNYCPACFELFSPNIVFRENFETVDALHEWFQNVLRLYTGEQSQYDLALHESLIGRLIGPASLLEVRTNSESILRTAHQIEEEHGTAAKIQTRFMQLNPEQLAVKFNKLQFLWIRGEPASGKTVLAYMKIQEILEESSRTSPRYEYENEECAPIVTTTSALANIAMSQEAHLPTSTATCNTEITTSIPKSYVPSTETTAAGPSEMLGTINPSWAEKALAVDFIKTDLPSVIYVFAGLKPDGLKEIFESKLQSKENGRCKVVVTSFEEYSGATKVFMQLEGLPKLIRVLQEANEGKIVHIICDECHYALDDEYPDQLRKDWDTVIDRKRLGYVWCIQSTYYTEVDSGKVLPLDFSMVHLTCIMRLSRQNIEIANKLLEIRRLNFKSGHAVTGLCPVMYRMKCVCDPPKGLFICKECYDIRIVLLLQHALDEFGISRGVVSRGELGLRDVVLICEYTSVDRVGTYLKDVCPQIPFAVNRCTVTDTNCMTVCGVEFYRGCEQRFVLIDFYVGAMDYYIMKEALTRTLGQLVILDCGYGDQTAPSDYEAQIQRVMSAREADKIKIKEIERSAEDVKKMNLSKKDNFAKTYRRTNYALYQWNEKS